MSLMLSVVTDDFSGVFNARMIQSVQLADYGVDIFMLDPNASVCVQSSPAAAKALYAQIYNALQAMGLLPDQNSTAPRGAEGDGT